MVSDKSESDGFFVFRIMIDSVNRRITAVENEGFRSSGLPNRDMEGICYLPSANTVLISGEKDNEVYEYTLDGKRTGRQLDMPADFKHADKNLGLESLCYDARRHLFYTTTERPLKGETTLRIQTFGDDMKPRMLYHYQPDAPISRKHYHGVSELCVLDDGRLLVLERQLRVPRLKIGASATVRIYETWPTDEPVLEKKLLTEFKTRLNLFSRKFANYEGMCQPFPELLLLIADSQNQYKGVLHDWLKLVPTSK